MTKHNFCPEPRGEIIMGPPLRRHTGATVCTKGPHASVGEMPKLVCRRELGMAAGGRARTCVGDMRADCGPPWLHHTVPHICCTHGRRTSKGMHTTPREIRALTLTYRHLWAQRAGGTTSRFAFFRTRFDPRRGHAEWERTRPRVCHTQQAVQSRMP